MKKEKKEEIIEERIINPSPYFPEDTPLISKEEMIVGKSEEEKDTRSEFFVS